MIGKVLIILMVGFLSIAATCSHRHDNGNHDGSHNHTSED
jgi:hypothetical protein